LSMRIPEVSRMSTMRLGELLPHPFDGRNLG
jgi:hypothetical protein